MRNKLVSFCPGGELSGAQDTLLYDSHGTQTEEMMEVAMLSVARPVL